MSKDTFNAIVTVLPLGRLVNIHDLAANIDDLFEVVNGVKYLKDGGCRGEFKTRHKFLNALFPLAALGGSWQEMEDVEGLIIEVPDKKQGELPYLIMMTDVAIHIPKELIQGNVKGGGGDSPENLKFTFDVKGQVVYGIGVEILPIFAKRNQAGID
ncbi:MAG: hypothetical protein OEY59_13510 [Deltaproteobacteria bacterium]|nr:hypothetical protein [Deltaproteobacteria bacterium]